MGNALRARRIVSAPCARRTFSAVRRGSGDIIHHQLKHGAERRLSRATIYGIERRGIQFEEEVETGAKTKRK